MNAERAPQLNPKMLSTDIRGISTHIKSITVKQQWEIRVWTIPTTILVARLPFAWMDFSCCHHFAGYQLLSSSTDSTHVISLLSFVLSQVPFLPGASYEHYGETKATPFQVNGLQVWNQLSCCVFIASIFVLFSMAIVYVCMEGCALPPVYECECVCWKEPSVAWPRLLRIIAPCLVTCQLISLWVRERPGRATYSTSRSSPSL